MNQFFEILRNYWKPILAGILVLISFFIALIRKRPISDILTDIYYYSIKAVNEVEADSKIDTDLKGYSKLEKAVTYVLKYLGDKYPTINFDGYVKLIGKVIEELLTTPQKKGDKNG